MNHIKRIGPDPAKYVPQVEYFIPVFDEAFEAELLSHDTGFCIYCGNEASNIEPDARRYKCESCGNEGVYGLEELLVQGLVKVS